MRCISSSEAITSSRKSTDATHRRTISAPSLSAISTGSTVLPSDFDWARPCGSSVQPAVAHAAIGRCALGRDGAEQGRLEPSAMLIAALEVQVGGPGKSRLAAQHRRLARSRLEPHVDDVHLLAELRRCRTWRTWFRRAESAPANACTRRPRPRARTARPPRDSPPGR